MGVLRVAMRFLCDAPVLNRCRLICLRRILVHFVERAELDPEDSKVTEKEHFAVIVALFGDFLRIFEKVRQLKILTLELLLHLIIDILESTETIFNVWAFIGNNRLPHNTLSRC